MDLSKLERENPATAEWLETHEKVTYEDLFVDSEIRREVESLIVQNRIQACARLCRQHHNLITRWRDKLEVLWGEETQEAREKARGKRIRQLEHIHSSLLKVADEADFDKDRIAALNGAKQTLAEVVKVEGSGAPTRTEVSHESSLVLNTNQFIAILETEIKNAATHEIRLALTKARTEAFRRLLPDVADSQIGTPGNMVIEG